MTSDNEISGINFDRWCKINGELSENRIHAEEVISESVALDLGFNITSCYNEIKTIVEGLTPLEDYRVKFAITKLADLSSKLPLTYVGLLASHGGDDSHDAPHNVVRRACEGKLEEEFKSLGELWKEVNT